jgi:hypothetical protein
MNQSKNREIIPSKGPGLWDGLTNYFKLIARLMVDSRVNPLLKILPVGTLVYLVSPDLIPFVVDDALIIWLGTYLFVELCPPEVVAEHRAKLEQTTQGTKPISNENEENPGEFIDAVFREEKEEK